MTASRIEYLFNRHLNNACSQREKEEIILLVRDPVNMVIFKALIQDVIEKTGLEAELPDKKATAILANILHADRPAIMPVRKRKATFATWMSAAAVMVVIMSGTFYYFQEDKSQDQPAKMVSEKPKAVSIRPGTDKALLTTADGSIITLDSFQNGNVAQDGNAHVQKQGAVLIYNAIGSATAKSSIVFNTLSTPRGGQYKVILSDGTKVWLNAASSLHFPTVFTGSSREVDLTGEAYFEVQKDRSMPFHVKVNGMQVNVLGTHFNINAYSEEPAIKTSLLEGSVQIINGSFSNQLKPGEQAAVTARDEAIKVKTADMDAVIAWKNGLFVFEGADITAIMLQISRWYDVNIVYSGKVPPRSFEGKISRNAQLSDVLQILELSNINFTVEGKRIIVK